MHEKQMHVTEYKREYTMQVVGSDKQIVYKLYKGLKCPISKRKAWKLETQGMRWCIVTSKGLFKLYHKVGVFGSDISCMLRCK